MNMKTEKKEKDIYEK